MDGAALAAAAAKFCLNVAQYSRFTCGFSSAGRAVCAPAQRAKRRRFAGALAISDVGADRDQRVIARCAGVFSASFDASHSVAMAFAPRAPLR